MNDRIPTADNAAKLIIDVLVSVRNDGASVDQQLSSLKAKLFDEEFVRGQDRQAVLKKVNKGMGVNWSMNQVKRADGTLLDQITSINSGRNDKLIPVDELHGSSTVKGPSSEMAPQLTATERLLAANASPAVQDTAAQALATEQVVAPVAAPQVAAATTPAAPVAPTQSNTSEENLTMNLHSVNSNNTNTNNTAAADAVDLQSFINSLTAAGAGTPELRKELWVNFITQDSMINELWKGHTPAEGVASDQVIYDFVVARQPVADAFLVFLNTKTITGIEASAEAKSRFSFTGERDEGIRTSWIAAGSAIIGGGLEMTARGGLTMGAAIGTVLGAGASFFAGEMIDDHVEGQFGRYVAGGTLGLILGAGGSALGRSVLPGETLMGNKMNAELPAPSAPAFQTPIGVSASLAGL